MWLHSPAALVYDRRDFREVRFQLMDKKHSIILICC